MPVIETHNLTATTAPSSGIKQVYCALDCCVTLEVFEQLSRLRNESPEIYNFERAMQGPLLEIMLRGFKINEKERQQAIQEISAEITEHDAILQQLARAVWDKELNPRSPKQLQEFFYQKMRLPEQWISDKGKRRVSTNREALEKLELYFHARPIISLIFSLRDLGKQRSVLESEVDSDGRMRTSYNMTTETGRLSSSKSAEGRGTNLQNLQTDSGDVMEGKRHSIRRVFVSDPGMKLCGIDLEQTESHDVGWIHGTVLGDWTYLDSVEAGDIHTTVAKLIWTNLPWTGDRKRDRDIAEQPFYRNFTYRDMAKRGGHASNYRVTPWTMSRALKIPMRIAEEFQEKYYGAFPAFPKWFRWVAQELQTKQQLTTPFGRERTFFGRPNDDATLREAIAYVPQSTSADRMNLGLWRLWHHGRDKIQCLAQVHDAVYFQYRPLDEAHIIPWALDKIKVPVSNGTRTMTVKGEAKVGFNWGNYHDRLNPDGLLKFNLARPDTRSRNGHY